MSKFKADAPQVFKEGEETVRVHIWLYRADIEFLDASIDAVKRSKFIRLALRKVINSYRHKAEALSAKSINLEDLEQKS